MGFFGKLIGAPDKDLMTSPLIGRGDVIDAKVGGVSVGGNHHHAPTARKCEIKLRVMIDHTPAFEATVSQLVPALALQALLAGGAVVAVRVDEKDHTKVAIDFGIPVPVITAARAPDGPTSAAYILVHGKPVTVVVVASAPMGIKNADGIDIHKFTLTVVGGVPTPYQTQCGCPVPASGLPLLYPGAKLHAMLGDDPRLAIIDWSKGAVTG